MGGHGKITCYGNALIRRVVQLVEHVSPKHVITGSSPVPPAYETKQQDHWCTWRHGAAGKSRVVSFAY